MKGNSVYKIPNGKLVKISLEFSQNKIDSVKIFGDFFLHPEEALEKIENELKGKVLGEKEITKCVEKTVLKNKIELFGISKEGIAAAILLAKESAKNAGS